jgi:translation initiation factor IF-1
MRAGDVIEIETTPIQDAALPLFLKTASDDNDI